MPFLAVLRHEEGVRLDPDPLVALYSELGESGAERVLCRAMEDLRSRLSEILRHADEGRGTPVARTARQLGIDAHEAAGNHAGLLEARNPPQHRGGGQVYAVTDLLKRERSRLLDYSQDLAIIRVYLHDFSLIA